MNYKCYICYRLFEKNIEAVSHLKKEHNLKDKKNTIRCTVNKSTCGRSFITFNGLCKHVKKCVEESNANEGAKSLDDEKCLNLSISSEKDLENSNLNKTFLFDSTCEESNSSECCNSTLIFDSEISKLDVNLEDSFVFNSSYNDQNSSNNRAQVFVRKFAMEFCQLKVSDAALNGIFRTTMSLFSSAKDFCGYFIEINKENPLEAFNCAMETIVTELNKFNSTYKREQILKSNENYIQPKEYAIGTQIDVKRDKETMSQVQTHTQSILYHVPLIEKLNQLFADDNFYKEYFDYNMKSKHVCTPGVFQDFCCGEIFRNNALFQEQPHAIQIQIFLDAFEICSPLKSKAGKHAVLGVYFTIKNMPIRFAYQLDNIHVLTVVRESDLKKEETGYSNILEIITDEVKILETEGIKVKHNLVLKGINLKTR